MTRLFTSLGLLGVAVVSACSVSAESPVGPSRKPTPVQPTERPAKQPGVGEVPADVIEKLRADIATQEGVTAPEVKVISSEAVTWPNGALGCPQPGEMYTQALVPGYRIELEAGSRRFVYHASERGQFKLCPTKDSIVPKGSAR